SHIRVGTFEYAAALRDEPTLRALADYTIARHYPELADAPRKHLEFVRAALDRQAALIARWQQVGFVHGVMNTDNMALSGETIDYGPCAFMNAYDPNTVFSSIDHAGRYAYRNQPAIAQWNLARLAEAVLPLIDADPERAVALATEVLEEFPARFEGYWLAGMRRKLGLRTPEAGDADLVRDLLDWMARGRTDYTNWFRALSDGAAADKEDATLHAWHARWQQRLARENRTLAEARAAMRAVNPAVIPRNHRVEEALSAAEERDDPAPLHDLLAALAAPYDPTAPAKYRAAPADECGYRTFCGT
ncbi:MAG: protein adenylyltransferase SelO family protein, partial [Gemmata sp.]